MDFNSNRQSFWAGKNEWNLLLSNSNNTKRHRLSWAFVHCSSFHLQRALFDSGSMRSLEEELGTGAVDLNNQVSETARTKHHTLTNSVVCIRYVGIRESLPRNNTYKQRSDIAKSKGAVRKFITEFRVWLTRILTGVDSWFGKIKTLGSPAVKIKAFGRR